MKKTTNAALVTIMLITISACEKKDLVEITSDSKTAVSSTEDTSSDSDQEKLAAFSDRESFRTEIRNLSDFFSREASSKGIESAEVERPSEITPPTPTEISALADEVSKLDFVDEYVTSKVREYEKFSVQFPELVSFRSVYGKYIELLKTKDKLIWEEAIRENPEFFESGPSEVLILVHTNLLSSIVNMDFAYQVGEEIVVYDDKGAYIIGNGNYELVRHVQSIQSNDITYAPYPINQSSRSYSVEHYEDFYFGNELRLHTRLLSDYILWGDACFPVYSYYAQAEAYPQINVNGVFLGYNAAEIIVGIGRTPIVFGGRGPFSSWVLNSSYCAASGHFGCAVNNSNQFKADYYYKVATGWGYLYYTSTVYI